MNEVLLMMVVAYVFVTALLLAVLLQSQLAWKLKALLVIVSVLFYYISYQTWFDAQGWPSEKQTPDQFLLHFAMIEEPDKETNSKGQIFLWLSNMQNQELSESPRAYRIEYTQVMHARVEEAINKIMEGKSQIGRMETSATKIESQLEASFAIKDDSQIIFSDVPNLALPEK